MNRKLLIGVTLASVAGTGGAAYATVASPTEHAPASASAIPVVTSAASSTSSTSTTSSTSSTSSSIDSSTSAASSTEPAPVRAAPRTVSYQVGDAGTVTIDVADGAMASHELIPAASWSIMAMSNTGTHVAVQFTNSERVVGFAADLVGADVVVSVTNDRLPGAAGPAPVDPLSVSVVAGSNDETPTLSTEPASTTPRPAPRVEPETPTSSPPVVPATLAPSPITAPARVKPPAASTTAPSSVAATGNDDKSEHEVHDTTPESHGSESQSQGGSGD